MAQRKNFIRWGVLVLGIVIVPGLWGMGDRIVPLQDKTTSEPPAKELLQDQTISEHPTHTGEDLKKALQSGKPVLVDFGANKCIACRQIRSILREMGKEYEGKAYLLMIDVWELPSLARDYRIQLIPTLVFFNQAGKEVFRRSGEWDKNSMIQKLKEAGME